MKKEITPLSAILRDLVEGGGLPLDPILPEVLEFWPQVVPEPLRPYVCLEGLRNGVLVVLVANAMAGQQLQFFKEIMAEQINRRIGRVVVQSVRLKVGPLPSVPVPPRPSPPAFPEAPRPLSRKEQGSVTRLTRDIKDPEIRKGLRSLMKKSLSLRPPESGAPPGNKRRAARTPPKGEAP